MDSCLGGMPVLLACPFCPARMLHNFLYLPCISQSWKPIQAISPTNFFNAQNCQHKVNGAKDAALFHKHSGRNFTACFKLQLLGKAPYFGAFLPIAVAIKSI
jgi:hypothetical protein